VDNTLDINIREDYFDDIYKYILNDNTRFTLLFGGGSSGKSYTLHRMAILWALQGRSILIIRKIGATLEKSSWAEVFYGIYEMGLTDLFDIRLGKRIIYSKIGSGMIMFSGLDDPEKIKSIRSVTGPAIDTIIYDELTEGTITDINQLLIRQRGKSKFPKRFYGIFNPISINHWLYKEYFQNIYWENDTNEYVSDDKKTRFLKVTYKDNSHLEEDDIEVLENFKYSNSYFYNVYCLGNWGVLGSFVYENIIYQNIDLDEIEHLPWRLGIDYGGLVDKNAFTISKYDSKNRVIYLIDAVEHLGMSFEPFAELIRDSMSSYGINRGHVIYTDTSDSRADEVLLQYGLTTKHAKKGAKSQFMQLKWMMSNKIIVSNNNKMVDAFNEFTWKSDKDGNVTTETIHEPDMLAAFRYSFTKDISNKKTRFGR